MESTQKVFAKPTNSTCSNKNPTKQYLNEYPNRLYTNDDLTNLIASLNKIDMGQKSTNNECVLVNPLKKIHQPYHATNANSNTYNGFKPDYISKDNVVAMDVCEFKPTIKPSKSGWSWDKTVISKNPVTNQISSECFSNFQTESSSPLVPMTPNDKAYLIVCSTMVVGLLFVASRRLSI